MQIKTFILATLLSISTLTYASDSLQIPKPINSATLLSEADSLLAIDSIHAALQKVNQIVEGDTNYVKALLKKTLILSEAEQFEDALSICEKGIKMENIEEHQAFRLNKGYVLNLKGEKQEAKRVYQSLLKDFPFYKEASNNLAFQYLELEEYDSSYAAYKKQAELYPFDINAHFNLGVFALNEGHLTETFLAFNMVILLEPYSQKAYKTLSILNELANNTKIEVEAKDGFDLESNEFNDIDLLIKNYIALKEDYKVPGENQIYVAKQNHLIFSQIQQKPNSNYFYNRFYKPFYDQVMAEGKYELMQLFELVPSQNNVHKELVSKNFEELKEFNRWIRQHWFDLNNMHQINFDILSGENKTWYYSSGEIEAIAKFDTKKEQLIGPYISFHKNGQIEAKGNYKKGEKDGLWQLFYSNGLRNQEINYTDGKLEGEAKVFHENGVIKEKILFKGNERNGPFTEYYSCGTIYRKGNYKDGQISGELIYSFESGEVEYEATFKSGKLNGVLLERYSTGDIYRKEEYNDGTANGAYELFWENGEIRARGQKVDNKFNGEYKQYHRNGKIELEGILDGGEKEGVWKRYYPSGDLEVEEVYKKGQLISQKGYTYHQKVWYEKEFNEHLIAYTYYDSSANVLSSGGDKRKAFKLKEHYFNGILANEGDFDPKEGKTGEWKYYDNYGNLIKKANYKNGKPNGKFTEYHPWGNVKREYSYIDNKVEGIQKEFYSHGQLNEIGYYENGKAVGIWKTFYPDGTQKSKKYFLDGELFGKYYYYAVNGKIDRIEEYNEGILESGEFYDTSGNLLNEFNFDNGMGIYERNHLNNQAAFRGKYILNNSVGEYIWYHPNGEIETKGQYKNDSKVGKWSWYYENGNLAEEGDYVNNMLHGQWKKYYKSGKISDEIPYEHGAINGQDVDYHTNGKVSQTIDYRHGNMHGEYRFYGKSGALQLARVYDQDIIYKYYYFDEDSQKVEKPIPKGTAEVRGLFSNGNPSREFSLKNGYFSGDYNVYYFNGNKSVEYQLKYDERHGKYTTYYENGTVKKVQSYLFGNLHGEANEYYENGKPKVITQYKNDKKHGTEKRFNNDGTLTEQIFYYNGEKVL